MKASFKISLISTTLLLILPSNGLRSQWLKQPFSTSESLWKVRFVDAATGWIVGQQFIYKTTDGGTSWKSQDTTNGSGYALCALNENVVFYATDAGAPRHTKGIRRTTDGGEHWQTVDTVALYYTDLQFVDLQTGFAVGGTWGASSIPTVRKTTDGGATWLTAWSGPPSYEFQGVSFVDPLQGWAVTYAGLMYHTTDGGYNWVFQDSVGRGTGWNVPMRDVQFVSPDSGWAVGGISGNNVIAQTTNGGMNWTYVRPGGSSFREISMVDRRVGWLTGANNSAPFIARTTNCGLSWESQTYDPPDFLGFESISMVNDSVGWVCGEGGKVYRTTNGGTVTVGESDQGQPARMALEQNFPNPFNPTTGIRFQVSGVSDVRLAVYDLLGREVAVLVNEKKAPGRYEVKFEAAKLASGAYIYRLIAGKHVECRTMVLMK